LKCIDQAKADFIHCWELDPTANYAAWMIEWSTMCLQRTDSSAEAERLEAIAAIDPQHYLAFVCKAVASYLRANYEKASSELEQSITLKPNEADAYFWKGMSLASLGHDNEAISTIEQALALDIPPVLLSPLQWLQDERPDFYQRYALPLLNRYRSE
jgi:Flp pilus assembly protein TadD